MIIRTRERLNLDGLHETLDAALGDLYHGCAFGERELRVYLSDEATEDHIMDAIAIIDAHDPDALTPRQQRQAELKARRTRYRVPLDPDSVTLKGLAERVRWLEDEIREGVDDGA